MEIYFVFHVLPNYYDDIQIRTLCRSGKEIDSLCSRPWMTEMLRERFFAQQISIPGVPKKNTHQIKKFEHKLFQTKNLIIIFLEIYNNLINF